MREIKEQRKKIVREGNPCDGNRDGDEWRIASRRGRKTKLIRETKCVLWK